MIDVNRTTSTITLTDKLDHILARCGYRRSNHKIVSGLYALGDPTPDSPVFVTANYTLSFDALRQSLAGKDAYILVLDTKGINVWCAAGKGTFGTEELVNRINTTELHRKVKHRVLILPQLGAPGVCAQEVRRRSGFEVEYGPVRASDLPEYLKTHNATEEMRTVRFDLMDRIVLIPVELVSVFLPVFILSLIFIFLGGSRSLLSLSIIIISGTIIFPMIMPWLPTRDFSSKGLVLGGIVASGLSIFIVKDVNSPWISMYNILINVLQVAPWIGFLALNFTGSTPFTSRTGVKREIFTYIPVFTAMFVAGIALAALKGIFRMWGWL